MRSTQPVTLALLSVLAVAMVGFTCTTIVLGRPRRGPILTSYPASAVLGTGRPILGSLAARFTLVEFGDYQCPPCIAASARVQALLARNQRTLRFEFRNHPLAMHPLAFRAATA